MKIETATYVATKPIYSSPKNKVRLHFRTVSLCQSKIDTIAGVREHINEDELAKCFQLIDSSNNEVSAELEAIVISVLGKGVVYFERALQNVYAEDARTWKCNLDSAIREIPLESNVEILLGMYVGDEVDDEEICPELYLLGVIFRNPAKDGDDLTKIPIDAFTTTFVTNRNGNTLYYDISTKKCGFKQILPLTIPRPLLPFANCMHNEIRDLDKIENMNDGLCLKEYFKTNGNSFDVKFETMNSNFIKPAIKELLSNFPNFDKVRIYRETGTPSREELEEQLKDYVIPDDILRNRNSSIDFPNIDSTGHYVENKPKYMSLNELKRKMGLIEKPDSSVFKKEDC